MARVFISYRRVDGTLPVGWLAERLAALDLVTGVQTAFHDTALRAGIDLAQALDDEIAGCDVVLAVITPSWRGERADGARIMDPDDWVGREIAAALRQEKNIVPILVGGADHPLPSQMHESMAGLSRLLSVPFRDADDLDHIVEQVDRHLADLDRERAMIDGLDQPVEVPPLAHVEWLIAGSVVLAAALGAVGWYAAGKGLCPDGSSSCDLVETGGGRWLRALIPLVGVLVGAIAPTGFALARRVVRTSHVRWRALAATIGAALAAVVVIMLSLRRPPDTATAEPVLEVGVLQIGMIVIGSLAVLPWALVLNAAATMTARAPDHELAERVRHLGIVADGERWAAILLAVLITGGVAIAVALTKAVDDVTDIATYRATSVIVLAILVSALLVGTHLWNVARLAETRARLDADLDDVPPRYRQHASPRLIAARVTEGSWWFRAFLALPAMAAIIAVVVIELR